MNRLQATLLYSAMLARKGVIGMVLVQIVTTVCFYLVDAPLMVGADVGVVVYLLILGILYYHRHTAFCISNAVSARYRMLSFLITMGGIALLSAVLSAVSVWVIRPAEHMFWTEAYRYMVSGSLYFTEMPFAATLLENICYYLSVLVFGSLLGCLQAEKGEGPTLLMLLGATVAVVLMAWLCRYVNAISWVAVLPTFMLRTKWSAMVLSLLVTGGAMLVIYWVAYGGCRKERRRSHEAA